MKERKINYDNIMKEIKNQLMTVIEEDYSYFKNYKFVISSEQQFIKDSDIDPNNIFIVVRFLPASVNMGQIVLPMTITALSEQNNLKVCQTLFNDLSQAYNLKTSGDKKTRFIYESPRVFGNFTSVADGFRSLIQVSATFVVSENANFFTVKYCDDTKNEIKSIISYFGNVEVVDEEQFLETFSERKKHHFSFEISRGWMKTSTGEHHPIIVASNNEEMLSKYGIMIDDEPEDGDTFDIVVSKKIIEEIPIITKDFNFNNTLDTQPFFNTNNIANSVARYGTFNISFALYLLSDVQIVNDILDILCLTNSENAYTSVDKKFYLELEFQSGHKISNYFRLAGVNGKENIGDIPMINVTFAV